MSNICTVCNKDLSSLGEEGCEDCGQEYDPTVPDANQELDFNKEATDRFEQVPDLEQELGEALDNQLSPIWDSEDE